MLPLQAIAIFCEDIRSEASGQDTIVGTLPDNLNILHPTTSIAAATPMLSKLGLYLRMNFDTQQKPKDVEAKLLNTDNSVILTGSWTQDLIDKAFSDAQTNSMPFAGLILKVIVAPLLIPKSGKLTAISIVDGSESVAGAINLMVHDANVFSPPASQSPFAAPASS